MAKDIYHEVVKEALVKDGWTITDDPFILKLGGRDSVEIDLGAEKCSSPSGKTNASSSK